MLPMFKKKYFPLNYTKLIATNNKVVFPRGSMLITNTRLNREDLLLTANRKMVGIIQNKLLTTKAKYRITQLRVPTLTPIIAKDTNFEFVPTESIIETKPLTAIVVKDLSYIKTFFIPKYLPGNKVKANQDMFDTLIMLTVEPYNYLLRDGFAVFSLPDILPDSIQLVERMLKMPLNKLEKYVKDDKFYNMLFLLRTVLGYHTIGDKPIDLKEANVIIKSHTKSMFINIHDFQQHSKSYTKKHNISSPITLSDIEIIRMFMKTLLTIHDPEITEKTTDSEVEVRLAKFVTVELSEKEETLTKKELKELDDKINKQTYTADKDFERLGIQTNITEPLVSLDEIKKRKPPTKLSKNKLNVPSILPDSFGYDIIKEFDKINIKNHHHNVTRMIESLSMSGFNVEITETIPAVDIANDNTMYKFTIKPPKGPKRTVSLLIPNIAEDGTIRQGNSVMYPRKQAVDIPIKKISKSEVTVSSFYGKLFFKRGLNQNSQSKRINKYLNNTHKMVIGGDYKLYDTKLPYLYSLIGRETSSFLHGDILFNFNYNARINSEVLALLKGKKPEDIEKNKYVILGNSHTTLYLIDYDDYIYSYKNNKYEKISTLKDFLQIPDLPPEFIQTKIMGEKVPLILIMLQKLTLKEIFALVNVNPVEIKSIKEARDGWVLRFKDRILLFPEDNIEAMLLISGLTMFKFIKDMNYTDFISLRVLDEILAKGAYQSRMIREFINLFNLFVDPLTRDVLEDINEPTTFLGLLRRTVELLKDDFVSDVNRIDGFIYKGHDRISGLVYNLLAKNIGAEVHNIGVRKTYNNIAPYEIVSMLATDSTTLAYADTNPIATLKQSENITILGKFGRTKETVTMKAREFHYTSAGIVSEATKESGNVGMDYYTSATPMVDNANGVLTEPKDGSFDYANIFSTSASLAPFSFTEDGKRALFISVQKEHVRSCDGLVTMPLMTGYEYVMPYRVSDKYCVMSPDKGIVKSKSKTKITIEYKTLGTKSYSIKDWYTKDNGGKAYRHHMVTDLKKGDKINKDDAIVYTTGFFQRDLFNPNRLVYKTGIKTYVKIVESDTTFEDSCTLSNSYAKRLSTDVSYVKNITISGNINLDFLISIGEKTEYNTRLASFVENKGDVEEEISKETRDFLNELETTAPKAKAYGEVTEIHVYYNMDVEDMSKSVREKVELYDKNMVEVFGYKGRVNDSFVMKGKPLPPNSVIFVVYITKGFHHENGSKIILSNQLKATEATQFDEMHSIANDGTKIPIDVEFNSTSVAARIVPSFEQILAINTIMYELTDKVLEIWDA